MRKSSKISISSGNEDVSISSIGGSINLNGRSFKGSNVKVVNGEVYVDGDLVADLSLSPSSKRPTRRKKPSAQEDLADQIIRNVQEEVSEAEERFRRKEKIFDAERQQTRESRNASYCNEP